MEKITLLITDDHTLIRESWIELFNSDPRFEVVAACGNGEQAVELAGRLSPSVVMMDINLPGINGFEATERILKETPAVKILAVSLHTQPAYVRKFMKLGARGYVTKNSSAEEMMHAIVEVHNHRKYICQEIKNILAEQELGGNEQQTGIYELSKREIDIIRFLKQGFSSKEIALTIGLHLKTVEVHRYNILHKLNQPNVAALVNFVNNSHLAPEL